MAHMISNIGVNILPYEIPEGVVFEWCVCVCVGGGGGGGTFCLVFILYEIVF